MKKLFVLLFASLLVMGACGQKEDSSSNEGNKESEKDNKQKGDSKKENGNKSASNTEERSTEEVTTDEQQSTEEVNTNEENIKLNYKNVTNRSSLVEILYGAYTEEQKITAYNSAVSNGVIPQGNVLEGPASAAYESSLRVESGKEKSIYDQSPGDDSTEEMVDRSNVMDFVEEYEGESLDTDSYTFKEPEQRDDGSWGFAFYTKDGELAGSYIVDEDGIVSKFDEDGIEE